jgi:hypothetical protein
VEYNGEKSLQKTRKQETPAKASQNHKH